MRPPILIALCATLAAAICSPVSASVQLRLHASLNDDGTVIAGSAEYRIFHEGTEPLDSIPLWLYPNGFARPAETLDAGTIKWIYPHGDEPGGIDIDGARWDGVPIERSSWAYASPPAFSGRGDLPATLIRIPLHQPLQPGQSGTLNLEFTTQIPERRGRFGRDGQTITLGGPWFPRTVPDLAGGDLSQPLDKLPIHLELSLPGGRGAVIHQKIHPPQKERRTIRQEGIRSESLPLVVMKRMTVHRQHLASGEAIFVAGRYYRGEPGWEQTRVEQGALPEGIPPIGRVDKAQRIFLVYERAAKLFAELAPHGVTSDPMIFTEVPTWDRLVQPGPGPLLVSDHLYELIPVERAFTFHDRNLVRGIGFELAYRQLQRTAVTEQTHLIADMVGSYLAALYGQIYNGSADTLDEAIGFASFLPEVDEFIYAPQGPFRETYAETADDPLMLRDEPWLFMNGLPRGRRLLYKLQDLLGPEGTWELFNRFFAESSSLKQQLSQALEEDAGWFFDQWLGSYPDVNYRLVSHQSTRATDGTYHHTAVIARDGADIREPVTVLFIDEDGERIEQVWNGIGTEGIVGCRSMAPVDQVVVDPRRRLNESTDLVNEHPLRDNTNRLNWRPPLLMAFNIWFDTENIRPHANVTIGLKRKYDITNSIFLSAQYDPYGFSGSAAYLRAFGEKRTLNARRWRFGPLLQGRRHFAVSDVVDDGSETGGATTGQLTLSLGYDDRAYFWDPMNGQSLRIAMGYIGGAFDSGDPISAGKGGARFFFVRSPAIHHTFALYGGVTGLVGRTISTNLPSLSHRLILRGFDSDETSGNLGLYAISEYRHTLFNLTHISLVKLIWLDRLQGVAFAGAGTMSEEDSASGLFTSERIFAEVGYGLRLHLLLAGAIQYLLALDVAVPFLPLDRTYTARTSSGEPIERSRSPYKVVFGITQIF